MKTEPYAGPFPRKRHAHRCLNCRAHGQTNAVACYKAQCTLAPTVETCRWCRPVPRIPAPGPAPFVLEGIGRHQMQAEQAAQEERRRAREQREAVVERAAAPLRGDSSAVRQLALFGGDLFGGLQ